MVNNLKMPPLKPTPSVKTVISNMNAKAEAQNQATKVGGGDKIQVVTTHNAESNDSIKDGAVNMSRMEKVLNAQTSATKPKGGKRKRRTFRRRRTRTFRRRRWR